MSFSFSTDDESKPFCLAIVAKMVALFGISEAEALERVNRQWRGLKLLGPDDLIYHEDEEYWAKHIYYEAHSFWWLNEASAKPKSLS